MRSIGIVLLTGVVLFGLAAFGEVAEQEPNESPAQAMSIGSFGQAVETVTVSGAMDYAGDSDWYGFTVTALSVELMLSATAEDASNLQLVVYSSDVDPIEASENELLVTLAAGSYLLRVASSELGVVSYNLVASSALEIEPNDGVCIPTDIGLVSSEMSMMYAAIDPAGDVDFFAFEIAEASDGIIQLRTDGTSGDTILVLYQYDGEAEQYVPIDRDDDGGGDGWSMIFSELDPGKYIARVHEFGDDQRIDAYQFSVVQIVIEECEPNNSAADACALGSLEAGDRVHADDLLTGGDIDFFALTVNADGMLIVETSGPVDADSYICLRTPDDTSLGCDDDGGSGMWSRILMPVTAGQYVVTVEGYGSEDAFRYTLQAGLQQFASAAEQEPNDSPTSATLVESVPAIASGEITQGDIDVFTFTLSSATRVVAETTGPTEEDSYLCLFDSDGNSLWCDDDGGAGLWSRIDETLDAGTYSLSVEGYSGTDTFAYSLLILLPELEAE